jgi:hypothetical protein
MMWGVVMGDDVWWGVVMRDDVENYTNVDIRDQIAWGGGGDVVMW